jgi:hypothetical protein
MTNVEHAFQRMARIGHKPRSDRAENDRAENETATEYAEQFTAERAAGFHIGSPVEETTIAFVFAIEAARCLCNTSALDKAPLLLWMAIEALNPPQMGVDPTRPHKPISKLLEQLERHDM